MSCIDDSQEWRTFSDSSGPDRNRVGGTTNNMLHSGGLGTSVGERGLIHTCVGDNMRFVVGFCTLLPEFMLS